MSSPKDKAEELVGELIHYSSTNQKPSLENAKESALIAVDEILELIRIDAFKGQNACKRKYWQEVKSEINIL